MTSCFHNGANKQETKNIMYGCSAGGEVVRLLLHLVVLSELTTKLYISFVGTDNNRQPF